MIWKSLYRWVATSLMGIFLLSCGKGQPLSSSNDETQPIRLGKLAAKLAHQPPGRVVIVATLTQNGTAVEDAEIEISRSTSGKGVDYQWTGTTDAAGQATIEILGSRLSGYYLARAIEGGSVIGDWGSIPINAGRENAVSLNVGGEAIVTGTTSLIPATVFTVRIENVSPAFGFAASGIFNTPVGADGPGPIGPGGAYEFSFSAAPGSKLSFANMFVPSNDFFYGPGPEGIALWDENGEQVSGDVTNQIQLWDAGSEVDQEPGLGPDQVQRQSAPDSGDPDLNTTVRLAEDTFNNLPDVDDVIQVTITPTSPTGFTVRVENVSSETTLTTSDGATQFVPMSPGVWVVHTGPGPLFTPGEDEREEGLAAIAEDGNAGGLGGVLGERTGLTVPMSPGVWVVHTAPAPLFSNGEPDRGEGLAAIAEDGNAGILGGTLAGRSGIASGVFNTPVGADGHGPIGPGGAYEFSFTASPGASFSFANMFVPSNDFFYAPGMEGIALWISAGNPISGDITSQVRLWDVGSEINQEPGVGLDQVQRQSGPNTGAVDPDNTVQIAPDTFNNLPDISDVIRVTITPGS